MHQTTRRALLALILLCLVPRVASALLSSDYRFSVSTGSYTYLSGGTEVISQVPSNTATPFNENATSGPNPIGFSFVFNCVTYNKFSINGAGAMVLGDMTTASYDNDFTTTGVFPVITPYWDHLHYWSNSGCISPAPGVSYSVTGIAPNRVLTVEWRNQFWMSPTGPYYSFSCSATSTAQPMFNYQVKLYEGTNAIEFTYGYMFNYSGYNGSATIGIASGSSDFISVTPTSATSATTSSASSNNNVNMASIQIGSGVTYTFTPCYIRPIGRTGPTDGGTLAMAENDVLMNDVSIYFGQTATRTPTDLVLPGNGCPNHTYQLAITGAGASDYYFGAPGTTTTTGTITAGGGAITPAITFSPTQVGTRLATLSVRDLSTGCSRNYILASKGSRRIDYFGNVAQGGTSTMANGDTLLLNLYSQVGQCVTRSPFYAQNTSPSGPTTVTFSITGSEYSINTTSASLAAGASVTPIITFCPTDTGRRNGTLTVTADGVSTVYLLRGFGAYPAAQFSTDGVAIDSTGELYRMQGGCVGEEAATYPVDITTVGGMSFSINSIEVFELDTTIRQGEPRYFLSRDARGRLIPASDYMITVNPPTVPREANTVMTTPYLVPIGTTRVYLTLISSRPNKRYARIFIRTDALNLRGSDTNGALTNGLLWFDLYGRGRGSVLTDGNLMRGTPGATVFPYTGVGDSSYAWVKLANSGTCDLTLDSNALRIVSEDVNEFTILRLPGSWLADASGRYHMTPGAVDSIFVRFRPMHTGQRRASIYLKTNDSSVNLPNNNRGTYYLDLVGNGSALLDAKNITIGPGEIGSTTAPFPQGQMVVTNTSGADLSIASIIWEGVDTADFKSSGWPSFPTMLPPNGTLPLDISFQPMAGTPGIRQATVTIITTAGDTIRANVSAEAGTRIVSVNPTAINFPTMRVGRIVRKTVAITNSGTLPAEIDEPTLGGARPSAYRTTPMPRHMLAPGQTELLEVSYVPDTLGTLAATLTIGTHTLGGPLTVQLNGTGNINRYRDDDPDAASQNGNDMDRPGNPVDLSVAGVGTADHAGLWLSSVIPSPATGNDAWIDYRTPSTAQLSLYNQLGVKVLELPLTALQGRAHIGLAGLPAGQYTIRLESSAGIVNRPLVIVR